MQDRPNVDDILEIIATFLRQKAIPALPPRLGFEARIAATGLDLVRREIELGQLGEAAELERLREILGRDGLLEEKDDNIRFFDHRREYARTDYENGGLPDEKWEALLAEAQAAADAAGHWRCIAGENRPARSSLYRFVA